MSTIRFRVIRDSHAILNNRTRIVLGFGQKYYVPQGWPPSEVALANGPHVLACSQRVSHTPLLSRPCFSAFSLPPPLSLLLYHAMEPDSPIYCSGAGTFYACTSGHKFVGCCEANDACEKGCSLGDLRSVSFDPTFTGNGVLLPDPDCGEDSKFYTCAETSFWGCCKSTACLENGCPDGNLTQASMHLSRQYLYYSDMIRYGFNSDSQPRVTRSVALGISAPTSVTRSTHGKAVSKSDASISIGVSLTIALTGCLALAVWLCCRRFEISARRSTTPSEK